MSINSFAAKTKNNQCSVGTDVINASTLVVGGQDTSLAYNVDTNYSMNVLNNLNVGGTITVNGLILGNVQASLGNPALRTITINMSPNATNQGYQAIGIGYDSGDVNQGANSIAMGSLAGKNNQPANSIVLNATGVELNGTNTNALYVDPIRNATSSNILLQQYRKRSDLWNTTKLYDRYQYFHRFWCWS